MDSEYGVSDVNAPVFLESEAERLRQLKSREDTGFPAAVKSLADRAREAQWRPLIGSSGVFSVCLDLVSEGSVSPALEQALRLVGNCVADNDNIRAIALREVEAIRGLLRVIEAGSAAHPLLTQLALSVAYNLSLDYGPAQQLFVTEGFVPMLINSRLIAEGNEIACELLEIMSADASASTAVDEETFHRLLKAAHVIEEHEPFASTVQSILSLLSSPNCHAFLQSAVGLSIYSDLLDKTQELVTQYQNEVPQDDQAILASFVQSFHGLVGKLYEVASSDSFPSDANSELAKDVCSIVKQSNDRSLASQATFFIVLASMTRSDELGVALVQKSCSTVAIEAAGRAFTAPDKVMTPSFLHASLQLLVQLSIPTVNKPLIVEHGAFNVVYPILGNRSAFSEDIHLDALTLARRLIASSPGNLLHFLTQKHDSSNPNTGGVVDSGLSFALQLHAQTDKASVKLEIGRLVAEVCRTTKNLDQNHSDNQSLQQNILTYLDLAREIPGPLAFAIVNAQSPGAKTEGWFALGILSSWPTCRSAVTQCLERNEDLRSALEKIASEEDKQESIPTAKADLDNARVLITNIAENSSMVSPELKTLLHNAARSTGLEIESA